MASEPTLGKAEPRGELPRNEESWRAVFENCPFGVAIADLHDHAVVSNSIFQNWLGYTEGLLPASDLPPVVVPLLMLVWQPLPLGGAERNPAAMG